MSTVLDLITDAHRELNAVATGSALTAEEAQLGLRTLNRMLSTWANEELMIYTVDRQTFSLVGGKQSYTIGVGGDFNTTYAVRPGQINMASVLVNNVEIPVEILNDEQWRDVTVKSTSSTFPLSVWANGNYPLNTLFFWPVPTAVNSVILYLWGQITDFTDTSTVISLPQGYEDAIVTNLAVRMAPSFGLQASPTTMQLAASSKAMIRRMNWEPTYRSVDQALHGTLTSIGQRSRGYVID